MDDLQTIQAEAFRLCGTTDIMQAFAQIEAERAGMIELHTRNTAQAGHIHRLEVFAAGPDSDGTFAACVLQAGANKVINALVNHGVDT